MSRMLEIKLLLYIIIIIILYLCHLWLKNASIMKIYNKYRVSWGVDRGGACEKVALINPPITGKYATNNINHFLKRSNKIKLTEKHTERKIQSQFP